MRQAVLAGISALLMSVLLPGWLLPMQSEQRETPLVLIVEQPRAKRSPKMLTLRRGEELLELPLEEYLVGVVLSEMPASFGSEALKAQAVAARTFALRQMDSGKHNDCDLCADSGCCQAWSSRTCMEEKLGDAWEAYWEKAEKAVRETEGEAMYYQGSLIDAVYFSCSGGRTEAAVAVWGSEVPYLQSVLSTGEENAAPFYSETEISHAAFRATILDTFAQADLSGSPNTWFGEQTRTEGGGVDTLMVGGVPVKGTELRTLFRLRSTDFDLTVEEDHLVFSVRGYGHRVGMSQYGANAMAKEGKSYREILSHYYCGVEILKAD